MRPNPHIIKAKLAEIDRRYKRKGLRRSSPRQIVPLRLRDFATLFRSRYGLQLPDDDAGRDDLEPVIHHFAKLPDAGRRIALWLEQWAPWMTLAEQRAAITQGIATCRAWSADQLAWRYRVTLEQRTVLGLTTIGAIDCGKGERTKRRKARERKRKAAARQAAGAKPRAVYEAASAKRAKPWAELGISRRTWYRRKRGTGPATA